MFASQYAAIVLKRPECSTRTQRIFCKQDSFQHCQCDVMYIRRGDLLDFWVASWQERLILLEARVKCLEATLTYQTHSPPLLNSPHQVNPNKVLPNLGSNCRSATLNGSPHVLIDYDLLNLKLACRLVWRFPTMINMQFVTSLTSSITTILFLNVSSTILLCMCMCPLLQFAQLRR